jgi:hypothetical protein
MSWLVSSEAWRFAWVGGFVALALAAARSLDAGAVRSDDACGASAGTIAEVVEWSIEGQARGDKVAVSVAVELKKGFAGILRPPLPKVAQIGGLVRFLRVDTGEQITSVWLEDPDRPVAIGSQYSHRYLIEPYAGAPALARTPKQEVSAIVCVSGWTYDNGGQVAVN